MDLSTVVGLIFGFGGILLGNMLEGGHLGSMFQFTAALIVFGGTFGAVMVSHRKEDIQLGMDQLKRVFREEDETETQKLAESIIGLAELARKESLLAIEARLAGLNSEYMKNVFRFMIDGVEASTLRDIFEEEIENSQESELAGAKVWTDAGGYAPTIGIIGAVLGLIHVMGNLTNTSQLGAGIAVAFVATIYGVGSANLFFLPVASKIKRRIERDALRKRMILEGAIAILSGLNPYLIEEKMRSYADIPRSELRLDGTA